MRVTTLRDIPIVSHLPWGPKDMGGGEGKPVNARTSCAFLQKSLCLTDLGKRAVALHPGLRLSLERKKVQM